MASSINATLLSPNVQLQNIFKSTMQTRLQQEQKETLPRKGIFFFFLNFFFFMSIV